MANGAANYTEEMVMAMVTTQLTIMSFPFFNVQIVPFSSNFERLFGADTRIPGSAKVAPFYMDKNGVRFNFSVRLTTNPASAGFVLALFALSSDSRRI
ncbi:MAG: hypothetical protein LCH59_07125 [Proteobacteria bacterium]|nr:hypothetical protein [Pseudomonadota bacterium]